MLLRLLNLATVVVLVGTLPLALIAVRGFRNTPFVEVLEPIPVVIVAYIGLNVPDVVGLELPIPLAVAVSGVGVLGTLVAATRAILLLTERQPI